MTLPQLPDDGNKTPTVLLVDDRSENLLALEAVLGPLEIRLQKAANADAALWFLLHNDVALILLDVEMPGIDGFEVLRWLQTQSFPELVVIVLSGSERREDITLALQLGAHYYQTKQIDLAQQIQMLNLFEQYMVRQKRTPG